MSDMYLKTQSVFVSHSKLKAYIFLLGILQSTDAVTLTGSSEYAVSGGEFTLTCDVPEEANTVQLYRRPDVTSERAIQVAGGQCYDVSTTAILCSPGVCSCTVTSTNYGKDFQWLIQPQIGDHDSVWYCRRTNPSLPDVDERIVDSADYTLKVRTQTVSLSVTPPSPAVGQEVTLTCTVNQDVTANTQVFYMKNTILVGRLFVNSTSCTSAKTSIGANYTFTCGALPVRQLSLTIPAAYVTEDEHGTDWRCNIFLGATSNTVHLILSVPVSTVTMTSNGAYHPNVTITAGNTRTFSCTTSASRPVAEITWLRGDNNVTDQAGTVTDQDTGDDKYTRQQSITITGRVNDVDSRLKCEAVNIQGRTPVSSQTSNIIVQWEPQVDPSLTRDPSSTTLTEDESVRLICRHTGGKPVATLTWSGACGGMTRTDRSDATSVTSSVQLSVNRTYNGQSCTCESRHPVNSYLRSLNQTLVVLYPPDQMFITYSNSTFDDDKANRQLRCAPDGNPRSFTFSKWQHMSMYGQLIRELDGVTSGQGSTLILPDPGVQTRYQDTGYYVCRVENGVTNGNNQLVFAQRVFLNVNAPPVFVLRNEAFPGQKENNVNVSIPFYSTIEQSKVELFRNQSEVGNRFVLNTVPTNVSLTFHGTDITVSGFTTVISVLALQQIDLDNYTRKVTNDVGIQQFGFYISDRGPPYPPTYVFADCKGYGSADVSWRAGNNGGYSQSFQVFYKTDGTSTVYPNIVTENGDEDYVMTLDNLEEHSLHIFTILALNSFGNVTSSEIGKCTVHERPRLTENSTMFDAGVAMMCTGVIALLLTVGIIAILLKRKDTCLSRHQQTEPPVHLENMEAADTEIIGTFPPGDERTLYEKLDSDGRVQPSVYESIGKPSNSNDATAEQQQDSSAYETLHGRSQPNTYEELDSIDNERRRNKDCIDNRGADYINT